MKRLKTKNNIYVKKRGCRASKAHLSFVCRASTTYQNTLERRVIDGLSLADICFVMSDVTSDGVVPT
jgi:hypothetical protein